MPRKAYFRISIATLVVVAAARSSAQDEPDLRKEQRLHNVYKSWNEKPTSDDSWKNALAAGTTQTYSVQKGDTLWDISETFFGDPNFYPKIWALNAKQMLNPHEITPSEMVQFVEGTPGEPPQMTLADKMEEEASGESSTAEESKKEKPQAENAEETVASPAEPTGDVLPSELPAPLYEPKKRTALPKSLPGWDPSAGTAIPPILDFQKINVSSAPPERYLQYFLTEGPVQGEGTVTETEANTSSAPENYFVYVKLKNGLQNRQFSVIEVAGEIKDKGRSREGLIVHVLGQIEIKELVNAKENLYRALVVKSLDHVSKGGILVPMDLPMIDPGQTTSASSFKAKVIGGEYDDNRKIFGADEIIYLNAGTSDGVSLGQVIPLYRVQSLRNEESEVKERPRKIGQAKIVKTSGQFATALVLNSTEEIYVGDLTDPDTAQE